MEETIFTKIIKGEIPSHKVYEDEKTLAFLDIFPETEGHTLVIPKTQVEFVWDLSESDYAALMSTVQKVAVRLRSVMGKKYVGSKVIGTDVPHAHVHLFPFDGAGPANVESFEERQSKEPDHAKLAEIAKKLYFS